MIKNMLHAIKLINLAIETSDFLHYLGIIKHMIFQGRVGIAIIKTE